MRRLSTPFLLAAALAAPASASAQAADVAAYRAAADRIIDAALRDSTGYRRLGEMTDRFGARFSGTDNLERALDWALAGMKQDGLANVRGEPVMVPVWVRGQEYAELVGPRPRRLPMLGLGGSIATPPEGITAEVLVVTSFDELKARAAEARGKIVLYDVAFENYGQAVAYRTSGAIEAARVGAVASLVRSVTPFSMQTPHTGASRYDSAVAKIPHAAITLEDAALLRRLQQRGERVVVKLYMEARTLPDRESRNVIAELRGREHPEEVVVLGGHSDSWDVGTGAMDDGGGVIAAWEAVRLLKVLGLQPRRTIRVVWWTNEENGLRGGTTYRDAHRDELDRHVAAIETDAGVFKPLGFGFTGSDAAFETVRAIGGLLERIGAGAIVRGGGGADIGPIMQLGVPGMGLNVEGSRYFWYHHTDADTFDKIDAREMAECTAALAIMAYVLADLPQPLPRAAR
jgi:carboxypeptidase Q